MCGTSSLLEEQETSLMTMVELCCAIFCYHQAGVQCGTLSEIHMWILNPVVSVACSLPPSHDAPRYHAGSPFGWFTIFIR
eukprot:UN1583